MSQAAAVVQPFHRTSFLEWITKHWLAIFLVVFGLWVGMPWLAPVLMQLEWNEAGRAIYFVYSLFCHQLPERSFFLFGPQTMYSLSDIQAAWQDTINPLVLRKFIGNEAMGWKVAWSDRMISFYASIWLFGLAWRPLRRAVGSLPWQGFALMLVPMILDGVTHTVSDLAGIGQGFRDSNLWLAAVTGNSLPAAFYAGDALGSFNSWTRLSTGLLAGLGIIWFAFPQVEAAFGTD
jgi:uncharacterized membrane protein